MKHRTVFFVSDRTGITAETLGLSLLSQFEAMHFTQVTLPFIDSIEKANEATQRINQSKLTDGERPLVFSTIVPPEVRTVLKNADAYVIDYFDSFISGLEKELNLAAMPVMGKAHGVGHTYNTRIEAVNYALTYDDGAKTSGYSSADVILIGVSRSGKTPTCLYLAMQFGLRAANYPLTEEDLDHPGLPNILVPYRKKLFGLTISAERLQAIRTHRKPDSRYATLKQCEQEVKAIENLYIQENIPYLNSTDLSIEELATKMIVMAGIERRLR